MSAVLGTGVPGALMRAEIAEQPERWRELARQRTAIDDAADLIRRVDPALIVIAARGSSDHAGLYGQYLAHNLMGVPVQLATPSTGTVYGSRLVYPPSVMLAISQSGASPDLIDAVSAAQRSGVPVIALTNDESSPLAGLAEVHVPLAAGPELSVAATKTYTAELLALHLLIHRVLAHDWAALVDLVDRTAGVAERSIPDLPGRVEDSVQAMAGAERALIIGRGYSMATAKEGALKLTETSALAASGWSAADATHGPLGQVGPQTPVVLLRADVRARESVDRFGRSAAALGARLLVYPEQPASSDVPDEALTPLLEILPLQQTALELSLRLSRDPDQPVGLTKVTKTL